MPTGYPQCYLQRLLARTARTVSYTHLDVYKRQSKFFRRRKFCKFTAEGVTEIDYKDLNTLRQYLTCLLYTSRCV